MEWPHAGGHATGVMPECQACLLGLRVGVVEVKVKHGRPATQNDFSIGEQSDRFSLVKVEHDRPATQEGFQYRGT